ncbi:alpha family phenol-soluble modulin [Staphylococcus petrasii]
MSIYSETHVILYLTFNKEVLKMGIISGIIDLVKFIIDLTKK